MLMLERWQQASGNDDDHGGSGIDARQEKPLKKTFL